MYRLFHQQQQRDSRSPEAARPTASISTAAATVEDVPPKSSTEPVRGRSGGSPHQQQQRASSSGSVTQMTCTHVSFDEFMAAQKQQLLHRQEQAKGAEGAAAHDVPRREAKGDNAASNVLYPRTAHRRAAANTVEKSKAAAAATPEVSSVAATSVDSSAASLYETSGDRILARRARKEETQEVSPVKLLHRREQQQQQQQRTRDATIANRPHDSGSAAAPSQQQHEATRNEAGGPDTPHAPPRRIDSRLPPSKHIIAHQSGPIRHLRGLLKGLRTRAKYNSSFAKTLRGQIKEIDSILAEMQRDERGGGQGSAPMPFTPSSLMTQRTVWQKQIVDFMLNDEVLGAKISLKSTPRSRSNQASRDTSMEHATDNGNHHNTTASDPDASQQQQQHSGTDEATQHGKPPMSKFLKKRSNVRYEPPLPNTTKMPNHRSSSAPKVDSNRSASTSSAPQQHQQQQRSSAPQQQQQHQQQQEQQEQQEHRETSTGNSDMEGRQQQQDSESAAPRQLPAAAPKMLLRGAGQERLQRRIEQMRSEDKKQSEQEPQQQQEQRVGTPHAGRTTPRTTAAATGARGSTTPQRATGGAAGARTPRGGTSSTRGRAQRPRRDESEPVKYDPQNRPVVHQSAEYYAAAADDNRRTPPIGSGGTPPKHQQQSQAPQRSSALNIGESHRDSFSSITTLQNAHDIAELVARLPTEQRNNAGDSGTAAGGPRDVAASHTADATAARKAFLSSFFFSPHMQVSHGSEMNLSPAGVTDTSASSDERCPPPPRISFAHSKFFPRHNGDDHSVYAPGQYHELLKHIKAIY